jgi:WD40 repeat protein
MFRSHTSIGAVLALSMLLTPASLAEEPGRNDSFGDPLPPGAVLRLGADRFRHAGDARALAFSPDDRLLAVQCRCELVLWRAETGQVLYRRPLPSSQGAYYGLDFSPDGKVLAMGDSREAIGLWEVASGKKLRTLELPKLRIPGDDGATLRYSPDGKSLAVTVCNRKACVLDVDTGKLLSEFPPGGTGKYALAFSPDGKMLAVGSLSPSVQLWDSTTGRLLRAIDAHKQFVVMSLAFSPDGKALASGSWDLIVICRADTGEELARFEAAMQSVNGLAFTPDGRSLVSSSQDGKARVWDLEGKRQRFALDSRMRIGRCLALSHDGKTAAIGTGSNVIRLWDVATGKERFPEFVGHTGRVNGVAFSPDGSTVLSGGYDGRIQLWDAASGRPLRHLEGRAIGLSLTADGGRLATCDSDKAIRIWDVAAGKTLFQQTLADTDEVRAVRFTPDGKLLVSADWKRPQAGKAESGGRLVVWDAAAGRPLREIPLSELRTSAAALDISGRVAAVGGQQGKLWFCDLEGGRAFRVLPVGPAPETALAFAPDGRTLLSGSHDQSLRLWEVATGKEIFSLQGGQHGISAVAFAPDGRLLASADGTSPEFLDHLPPDGPRQVRFWDAATGQKVAHFSGMSEQATALAFSPDGRRLASGLKDGTVLVWDMTSVARPLRHRVRELSADELESFWNDLSGPDVRKAYLAAWTLSAGPVRAVAFLKDRLRPVPAADPKRVRQWVAELDSERFAARDEASRELEKLEGQAESALRQALAEKPTPEVRKRVEALLAARWEAPAPDTLRALRALAALERIGSAEARAVLELLAAGADGARLTQEAKASLRRLNGRATAAP